MSVIAQPERLCLGCLICNATLLGAKALPRNSARFVADIFARKTIEPIYVV